MRVTVISGNGETLENGEIMNVDLSRQDAELIIRRFKESEQSDIDEQLLAGKLRQYFPEQNKPLHGYLVDFRHETKFPPMPAESEVPSTPAE